MPQQEDTTRRSMKPDHILCTVIQKDEIKHPLMDQYQTVVFHLSRNEVVLQLLNPNELFGQVDTFCCNSNMLASLDRLCAFFTLLLQL